MAYPYVIEVAFRKSTGCIGRILRSSTLLTEEQVESFYAKFCKVNRYKIAMMSHVLNRNLPVDTYLNGEYYESKALLYAESNGIISYRIKNNLMIYNQNYANKECIGGSWVENTCTYQRIVDLDSGKVDSKKLQRLQKDGWDNV